MCHYLIQMYGGYFWKICSKDKHLNCPVSAPGFRLVAISYVCKLKPNLEMVPDRLWFWKTCCGDWRYFIFWYMVILKRWPMWSFCAETVLFLGYSGSDLRALCEEAAMMPIRELGPQNILTIKANQVHFLKQSEHRYISFGFYSWLHNSWNKLLVISLRIRMGMSTCKAS